MTPASMSVHPFGSPDAATADLNLEEQYEAFVNIDGTLTKERDAAIPRVLYGRKGSGKSHYLRALNALKAGDPSVLAFGPSTNPPPHSWVIRLSIALQRSAIPTWTDLWQKAILASAAVTLLYDSDNRQESAVHATFTSRLEPATLLALGLKERPAGHMTPFGAARHLLGRCGTLERFHRMLDQPQWQVLEEALEPVLAGSPPLYFFLDNLDAVESFAPRPWQSCQRGLLDAILSLAEDSRWKRLHVVVALKDTVVQSLFDSVHGQKYVHSSMLHRLEWSTNQSLEFLRRKIHALPVTWLTGPADGGPAERWLARQSIANAVRGCDEDIEAYLLRHTLLLPRDIVEMGNCLCDAITRARERGRSTLTDDEVRAAVNRAAEQIGKTGIHCAGIEVARRLMPSDAPLHGASEAFGVVAADTERHGEDDMTYAISEQYAHVLTQMVRTVGKDRFDLRSLLGLKQAIGKMLPQPDVPDEAVGALWRLGMLGVIDGDLETGEATFFGHSEHDGRLLPDAAERFAFHPSMIDYLKNVTAIGSPVYPEPGFLRALATQS
jgi:hypothetical protein